MFFRLSQRKCSTTLFATFRTTAFWLLLARSFVSTAEFRLWIEKHARFLRIWMILCPEWNRPYARVTEFFKINTKKFVLISYRKIPKGKVWNALVEEKSSVRALNMSHQIRLIWLGTSTSAAAKLFLRGFHAAGFLLNQGVSDFALRNFAITFQDKFFDINFWKFCHPCIWPIGFGMSFFNFWRFLSRIHNFDFEFLSVFPLLALLAAASKMSASFRRGPGKGARRGGAMPICRLELNRVFSRPYISYDLWGEIAPQIFLNLSVNSYPWFRVNFSLSKMDWIQKIGRTDISKEAENDGNHTIKSDFLATKTVCF